MNSSDSSISGGQGSCMPDDPTSRICGGAEASTPPEGVAAAAGATGGISVCLLCKLHFPTPLNESNLKRHQDSNACKRKSKNDQPAITSFLVRRRNDNASTSSQLLPDATYTTLALYVLYFFFARPLAGTLGRYTDIVRPVTVISFMMICSQI